MEKREHRDPVAMGKGKRQIKTQDITLGLRQFPAGILGRRGDFHGGAGGEKRRDERRAGDGERGVDRGQRGKRHVHPTGHVEFGEDASRTLAEDIPEHRPDHRIDNRLGKEHEEDITRRDADGVVDIDLVPPFIDRAANRVQHHQRGDDQGDQHVDQSFHRAFAAAFAEVGHAVQPVIHRAGAAFHVGLDFFLRLAIRQVGHRHRRRGDDLAAVHALAGFRVATSREDDDVAGGNPRCVFIGQHLPDAVVNADAVEAVDIERQQVLAVQVL